ncbi:MAG: nitroreductase [Tenericutes bacterium HGW-Tenericutes-5]|nr:MAG: nitroreductase [Tenericutes bacterium HGW-Tenericutes-5]
MEFFASLKNRRSIYAIDKQVEVKREDILKVVEEALKFTPSAFNSESQRVVVLFDKKHDEFWEMVKAAIKRVVKPEDFPTSEAKINAFKNGYGTVMFFDDSETTKMLTEKFPLYKENFIKWAVEQNGMLQGNVWVGLESIGLGASLQHYNELIEAEVKKEFGINKNWTLNAQMPFGRVLEIPGEKPKKDLKERLVVLQ